MLDQCRKVLLGAGLFAAVALGFAPAVNAGSIVTNASGTLKTPGTSGGDPGTDGFQFTVGSKNLYVTGLGFYDQGADGLANSHQVGIFSSDANGDTLLAYAVVQSGTTDPLDSTGQFRYDTNIVTSPTDSTPVSLTLVAGQTYIVAATLGSPTGGFSSDQYIDIQGNTSTYSSDIGTPFGRYGGGVTPFTAPPGNAGGCCGTAYLGPQIEYVVPEPSAVMILAPIAILALALGRSRRRPVTAA